MTLPKKGGRGKSQCCFSLCLLWPCWQLRWDWIPTLWIWSWNSTLGGGSSQRFCWLETAGITGLQPQLCEMAPGVRQTHGGWTFSCNIRWSPEAMLPLCTRGNNSGAFQNPQRNSREIHMLEERRTWLGWGGGGGTGTDLVQEGR